MEDNSKQSSDDDSSIHASNIPFISIGLLPSEEADSSQPLHARGSKTNFNNLSINNNSKNNLVISERSPREARPSLSSSRKSSSNSNRLSGVLSIEQEDLDDFKHLQEDVKHALQGDDSEWLKRPGKDSKSENNDTGDDESIQFDFSGRRAAWEASKRIAKTSKPEEFELHPLSKDATKVASNRTPVEDPEFDATYVESRSVEMDRENPGILPEDLSSEEYVLYGNSLGFISPTNKWRIMAAKILMKSWFRNLSMVMLILLTIFLAIFVFQGFENLDSGSSSIDYKQGLVMAINIYFTIEVILKIIAFGLWDDSHLLKAYNREYSSLWDIIGAVKFYRFLESRYSEKLIHKLLPFKVLFKPAEQPKKFGQLKSAVTFGQTQSFKSQKLPIPRAFARSSWGRLELISTISFWVAFGLAFNDYDDIHGLRLFNAIMALRIFKLVELDTGLVSILRTLKYGFPELLNVGFMSLYFWIFFGILGVQTFKGSLKRQCIWINPDDPSDTYSYDMQFCGGYLNATTLEKMNYIFADGTVGPLSKGFLCPANSQCISDGNPYNGRVNFDNIFTSMELIFVIISANTFTDLMYYTMDSENMAASLFFIVAILVLTIWMVNLLIAVLYSSFEVAQEKYRNQRAEFSENFITHVIKVLFAHVKRRSNDSKRETWSEKINTVYEKLEWVFVLSIAVSVLSYALVSTGMSDERWNTIFEINKVVSYFLLAETAIRLGIDSQTPWKFVSKARYCYDFATAIISVILGQPIIKRKLGDTYFWLLIFPISRFYRVVMLFAPTRNLWKKVLKNASIIWNLSAFYFLFVFLSSLIVMIYTAGTIPQDAMSDVPWGFFSLPNSFITLFIIGSTENWTDSLYALQQYSKTSFSAFCGAVLLILWFILSNIVVLNIFIAVIAASFDINEDDKRPLQIQHYLKKIYPERIKQFTSNSLLSRVRKWVLGYTPDQESNDFKQFLFRGTAILSIAENYQDFDITNKYKVSTGGLGLKPLQLTLERLRIIPAFSKNPFFNDPVVMFVESKDPTSSATRYNLQMNEWEQEKINYLNQNPSFNNSFFFFPPNHVLRKFCQSLVPSSYGKRTDNHNFFDDSGKKSFFHHFRRDMFVFITFLCTLAMVIFSCYGTPLFRMDHSSYERRWIISSEASFVALFTLEFFIKTIADGFIYAPNAYLLNPWNRIDLVVLICLWADLIASLVGDVELARIIKAMSALRALRFLTISDMARVTFKELIFDGFANIFGACMVALSILFPYAIWGLLLFNGKLTVCNDDQYGKSQCYNEFSNEVFQWDVLMPRVYSDPILHLNTFTSAFRSMYEIVSLEGWTDLLENIMSTTGVGTPAELFASSSYGVFLIIFIFISIVFVLNLFVSFIIGNNARMTGSAYLTMAEKSWLEVKRLLSQVKPDSTPNIFQMSSFRRKCFSLAIERKNLYYSIFIQCALYLHIIVLLTMREIGYGNTPLAQNILFLTTSSLLFIDELMQIYGKGFKLYLAQWWNILRFVIILGAFSTAIAEFFVENPSKGLSNANDVFQLCIFFVLISQSDTLIELMNTATASLPSIFSLLYTWFTLFLVYAIALNQVFGLTKLGPNTTGNINCRTVTKSLILLFRCSFGEGWNYIMNDLTVESPYCYSDANDTYTDCGSKPYAYVLFMSWNILSMYIFVNMFVSLIVEKFSYVYHREDNKISPAAPEELRKFKDAWKKYDPDGKGELESSYLPKLMHSFTGPLSFKIWEGRLSVKNLVNNYMEVDPDDPYNVKVDFAGLNRELSTIDTAKLKERKLSYQRFVLEAMLIQNGNGFIRFGELIQQVPLYTSYDPVECLGIDDYVRRLYTMNKVEKLLENERNYDCLTMITTRWKYLSRKKIPTSFLSTSILLNDTDSDDDNVYLRTPTVQSEEFALMWSPISDQPARNKVAFDSD